MTDARGEAILRRTLARLSAGTRGCWKCDKTFAKPADGTPMRFCPECNEGRVCVKCDGPPGTFTREAAKREWNISGLCATCQTDIFGGA